MKPRLFDRREFLAAGAAAAALASSACSGSRPPAAGDEPRFDLVIKGGLVFDGYGGAGRMADVAVRGDRIVAVGPAGEIDAGRALQVLDATGLCVAPGFVDIHTHSDATVFEWPTADSRIRQGCTTEITGNCGGSAAPRDPARSTEDDVGPKATWTDVRSYRTAWEFARPAVNQALLVGHGTIRRAVIGDGDRHATAAELVLMTKMLEAALEQGAIGFSTGLEYVPGIYAPSGEIETLAKVVKKRGGLYATHMRNEEEGLLGAVDEALDIARRSGVKTQISHLKAAGKPHWPLQETAIERIEAAAISGLDVMVDAYPYTAYSTTLTILLEAWSREGGATEIVKRLKTPDLRARMIRELGPRVARDPGEYAGIVVSSLAAPDLQKCVGKNIDQVAELLSVEPAEACMRLIEASSGEVGYVGHGMSDANVDRVLAHPLVMIGSDGRCMAPTGSALKNRPHPRSYGTFPRVLGRYCRERGLFDLPTAVRKMTRMPAIRAGFGDRGAIAPDMHADIVLFDADSVIDGATFDAPQTYPTGLPDVLVNGRLVVHGGVPTGARPGVII